MKNKTIFTASLVLMVTFLCNAQNKIYYDSSPAIELSELQQYQLDSILQCALDSEALYTIIGKIKPMSSVASFTLPVIELSEMQQHQLDSIIRSAWDFEASGKFRGEIKPMSSSLQHQLDSIIRSARDFEASDKIRGEIKPMSSSLKYQLDSIIQSAWDIANIDSLKRINGDVLDLSNKQRYLDRISEIQTLLNAISYPDLRFVMVPSQNLVNGRRILQLNVVRVSLLDSLLRNKASFFGQFGFVPGSDPAVVVSILQGCGRYERHRAFGYLYGYPEYAIDFFVQAAASEDKTNEFVERNGFRIPTYSSKFGGFNYVYPKDHTPDKIDSSLYFRAQTVLNHYKELRKNYLNQDGTLQSRKLLNDFFGDGEQAK